MVASVEEAVAVEVLARIENAVVVPVFVAVLTAIESAIQVRVLGRIEDAVHVDVFARVDEVVAVPVLSRIEPVVPVAVFVAIEPAIAIHVFAQRAGIDRRRVRRQHDAIADVVADDVVDHPQVDDALRRTRCKHEALTVAEIQSPIAILVLAEIELAVQIGVFAEIQHAVAIEVFGQQHAVAIEVFSGRRVADHVGVDDGLIASRHRERDAAVEAAVAVGVFTRVEDAVAVGVFTRVAVSEVAQCQSLAGRDRKRSRTELKIERANAVVRQIERTLRNPALTEELVRKDQSRIARRDRARRVAERDRVRVIAERVVMDTEARDVPADDDVRVRNARVCLAIEREARDFRVVAVERDQRAAGRIAPDGLLGRGNRRNGDRSRRSVDQHRMRVDVVVREDLRVIEQPDRAVEIAVSDEEQTVDRCLPKSDECLQRILECSDAVHRRVRVDEDDVRDIEPIVPATCSGSECGAEGIDGRRLHAPIGDGAVTTFDA